MTKLLFHSYHFPPIGGSGAQRPLKMVRHLAELGYESIVVTGGGATTDRWAPEDATLLSEVPAQLEIKRVPAGDEPEGSTGWRRSAERWLGLREPWSTWWTEASYRVGLEAGAGVDLIYVWMQPYVSAETGAALSRALAKPWVADLGDPWALDEMMIYPTGLHRRRAINQMRKLLGTAAAIVMSTREAVQRLLEECPELGGRPVVAIPNGFDAADFTAEPAPRTDGKFRIVHTGYLHTALGLQHERRRALRQALRSSIGGVEILTRSHVHLVEAINRLIARDPELADTLELHLAGVTSAPDREVADRCPVATLHGYMTHGESIELMQTAELLFLPMQKLRTGVRATIVPGKTYEYLASGTPILAAVPEGDARDILREAGNAMLTEPGDVDGIAEAIRAALERFRAGQPLQRPAAEVVARFEYRKLAGELAGVFDTVLDAQRGAAPPAGKRAAGAA